MPLTHKSIYLLNNHRIIRSVHWKTIYIEIYTLLTLSLHPFSQIQPTKSAHTSTQSQITSHTHTLTQSFSNSFFLLLINLNTHPYPHSPTQSLAHTLTHAYSFKNSIITFFHSSEHSLTYSYLLQSSILSLSHKFIPSLTQSIIRSQMHAQTHTLHSFFLAVILPHTHPHSLSH
jgi:hypothetical protein